MWSSHNKFKMDVGAKIKKNQPMKLTDQWLAQQLFSYLNSVIAYRIMRVYVYFIKHMHY